MFSQSKSVRMAAALALFVALLAPPLSSQHGARVKQQNLAELVTDADVIVSGKVVDVYGEPHPQYTNLYTIVVTLNVGEVLKGRSGSQFQFRQYVWDVRDRRTSMGYKNGQELLLLMIRAHSQTGLSSPAGLEQGRFRVTRDEDGNASVVNGNDNRGLFRGFDQVSSKLDPHLTPASRQMISSHLSGPIPYAQFKQVVQALVANQ